MTVERIRQAILDEARAEAEKIEAEARAGHDGELEAARRRLDQEFEQRFELGRQAAELDAHQRLMLARSRHNLALLQRRNTILNDLFKGGGDWVAGLDDGEYRALIAGWMGEVPDGYGGEVLCNERDAARLAPLVEELNRARPPGAQFILVPGERPALGGVIFRAEKFEVDLSLDSRLARLREDLAPEVAQMVFPEQEEL